ncbi:MAG TPA: hypothetical protein VNW29_03380 [Candidatus Sulfotelmatobacter sp.]|jgi:hypothetical protein|nr:hypothetical protein [Candidatus Sulfotelmatobacter sp.]
MNKKMFIIVVVLVLIVLGGGVFSLLSRSSKNPLKYVQNQMTTSKKSLLDLVTMVGILKCTFSDKTNNSSGVVYVSGGKMRGDFQSQDGGKITQSHMINDGSYIYVWTNGVNDGYKTTLATIKDMLPQSGTSGTNSISQSQTQSGNINFHQQTNYSCNPWSVDTAMFLLPQGVTFTDYSSLIQKIKVTPPQQGMTTQQQQSTCSQCDQVPSGAMRNQCRTAMKCP